MGKKQDFMDTMADVVTDLVDSAVRKVAEVHQRMDVSVAELRVLKGALRTELANLRGEVAELKEAVESLAQTAKTGTQAWCKAHKTWEPGVPHEEPDYMPGDFRSGWLKYGVPLEDRARDFLTTLRGKCRGDCDKCK